MVGRPPMRMKSLIVAAIISASMLIAAPAFAQTASQGYSKPSGSIQERISTEREPRDPGDEITETRTAESRSELPFTGLAAVPLIVLGLGLIATGAMLYRSARRAPSEA